MSLTLSRSDLQKLSSAAQILTRPLDQQEPDSWRSAVLAALGELLQADTSGFHLPLPDRNDFYSDDYPPEVLDRYGDMAPPPLPGGTCPVRRATELGVGTLEGMYAERPSHYLRSEYYNHYARALGKQQTLFAAFGWGERGAASVACLQFFRAHPTRRPFGEREMAILGLLLPAYRAGAEMCLQWGSHAADLLRMLETLDSAAVIRDEQGKVVHRTRRIEQILRSEPERDRLEAEMIAVAMLASRLHRQPFDPEQGAALTRAVHTGTASYRIRCCGYAASGTTGLLIVTSLDRCSVVMPTAETLHEHFRLTPAEARTALLIAQGKSNGEVARLLGISEHTARRHTERVFFKLKVRSRGEVGPRLLSLDPQ